ncbi:MULTISPECIES: hypothetical protein [unclassified Streptomyces]|uniref:hypothetical protein n=1 Tax=unclassified Streptomyces TaxID=2593676 RepID=UPI00178FD756|nr:hypothetical protein [Streptomyces sp. HD]MDC0768187.1 hypothetical protein [Streptomyces sp. HD]NUP21546.1 hypothetical protein [Streptomyces sp.]NUT29288.1 hypothetical protein [Streptomyces sp.]
MRYEIRIDGQMSDDLTTAFPELDSFVVPHQTVLYGQVNDDAHLYGLLIRFQSLGLRIVEFRQVPE